MNNLSTTKETTVYVPAESSPEREDTLVLKNNQADSSMVAVPEAPKLLILDPGSTPQLKVFDEVIQAMGTMMEVRDVYTAGHQQNVARISVEIARLMALPAHQIKCIQLAGRIHDIGKLAIPAEILSKPGKLSSAEFDMIKTHPSTGFAILRDIEFPWPIAQTVLQHHERMNGSGYPHRLSRYQILLEAKIIAVADVVEAMASARPSRPAIGIDRALEEITRNRHELYDDNVVEACLKLFAGGFCV
jgi:putative two-component system response regulator